jgi:hypothetical protein
MTSPRPWLTKDVIGQSVHAIRESFGHQMKELLRLASDDHVIDRLTLHLAPWDAAYRFPIWAYASTEDGQEPRTETTAKILDFFDSNGALLASEFKRIPLGREDVGGLDFTEEANWISEALIAEIQTIWNEAQQVCRPTLAVLISLDHPSTDEPELSFLNLRSGRWERLRNHLRRT